MKDLGLNVFAMRGHHHHKSQQKFCQQLPYAQTQGLDTPGEALIP